MPEFTAARRESLIRYLARHVAGDVRFDATSRRLYATDASHYQIEPLGVVVPKTADDLKVAVQIAADLGVPITARGGGTSLTGQSIGPGIVLDCSTYLTRIGELDPTHRTVRVQPGVVLDHLNRYLAPHGLQFGPDVATANRATLGGMIGNNSAGARSVVYGQTVDHVRSLDVILSDGTATTFRSLTDLEFQRKLELRTREGDIYRTATTIIRDHADEIDRRFPKILRKVSGYNLALVQQRAVTREGVRSGSPGVRGEGSGVSQNRLTPDPLPLTPSTLVPLLVGSEGTLAVVTEAELRLVPRPKCRGLLVPHFASLKSALDAVAVCLAASPSAVELMDRMLLDLARTQRALKRTMAAISGHPEALLMVEFTGETPGEVADRVAKLAVKLTGIAGLMAAVPALDPDLRDPLWNLRSAAVPLLYGMPGDRKPVTFVEDCAVSPAQMPEFAIRFRDLLHEHGTTGAFYGHASVGCLHIRPVLNLHDPTDLVTMRRITEAVTDLVLEFNGSLSGEHGDGLVRSEWNRKMFGPIIYEAFRQVKRAFDPENVLNPGKIVDAPAMEDNLRLAPGVIVPDPPTVLDYSAQGGFFRSIELCNGAGVCRKTQGGAMCPSFRATRDERDSTRGRANALRHAMTADEPLASRWLAPVMDLCLSCKACKAECPSNVDVAKLKAEFQQAFYANRTRPLGHQLVRRVNLLSRLAAPAAGVANWFGRRPFARGLLEAIAGIDRRRSLPTLHRNHFRRWFRSRRPATHTSRVLLLDDCFTTFQEPRIGQAAVLLLERAGYQVELASLCCGRAMISKGFLTDARDLAREAIPRLTRAAAAGVPILGLEPSCLLTLVDEWPELVPGPAAKAVAAAAHLAEAWLARGEHPTPLRFVRTPDTFALHPHCHQLALVGSNGSADALRLIPGATVTTLDAGCCGMAGAFGYEKGHYDISMTIARQGLVPALAAVPDAVIVAPGTSCRHQVKDATSRRAVHPLEILAAHSM